MITTPIRFGIGYLLVFASAAVGETFYTATPLPIFGIAINNSGQVVGRTGDQSAIYSNGVVTYLGTLPPLCPESCFPATFAYALNDLGQVTGEAYRDILTPSAHTFLYSNGALNDIGALIGFLPNHGRGINDAGQIIGITGAGGAFLYSDGIATDLGTLPGGVISSAAGINNAGQVTGSSTTSDELTHAFIYNNGMMTDLGALPGYPNSQGVAINNSGQVAGTAFVRHNSSSPNNDRAFLYTNGTMINLGLLPGYTDSEATAINNAGQVVGFSFVPPGAGNEHAFIYSNGIMTDLNDDLVNAAGLTLTGAKDDLGQILASGTLAGGGGGSYLLTPVVVPEPHTWTMLGIGVLCLAATAWKAAPPRAPRTHGTTEAGRY